MATKYIYFIHYVIIIYIYMVEGFVLFAPVIFLVLIAGFTMINLWSRGLALFPELGGGAIAIYSAIGWIISGLVGAIISYIPMHDPISLAVGYLVFSFGVYFVYRYIHYQEQNSDYISWSQQLK